MLSQAKNDEERVAIIRRDYEGRFEQFRQENAKYFGLSVKGDSEYSDPLSPEPFERWDLLPENSPLTLPQGASPSRLAQETTEDRTGK